MENNSYHNESYLLGLKDAVKQIENEYDCCKLQFEGQESTLLIIKSAFSRAISLIETKMIQSNSNITINQLVNQFNLL